MNDQQVTVPSGLSDRAAVALLTLRLRTVEKELLDARAAASAIDVDTARQQLRAKLLPLEEKRRAALEEALAQAEQEAAAAVEAARHRAAFIAYEHPSAPAVDIASPATAAVIDVIDVVGRDEAAASTAIPSAGEPAPSTLGIVGNAAEVAAEEVRVLPAAPAPAAAGPARRAEQASEAESRTAAESTPEVLAAPPAVITAPQIVFDAETFARVFATVIAETIEKTRFELQSQQPQQPIVPPVQYSPGMPMMPGAPGAPYGQYPMYYMPPQPPQQGFWSHAKHPDVFLLGIATAIVMTILVAWLS